MCYNNAMKEYLLSYYTKFKCVAGECAHSCCKGWEMCIDEKNLNDYKNCASSFAPTLKKGVNFKKGTFTADKNGSCAFLIGENLCEIIINLGEEGLCQICRDHPRFRSCFDDRVETGLGFACEEATRIILSYQEKIRAVPVSEGVSEDISEKGLPFIQAQLLKFRTQALDIIQDRSVNINDRLARLLALCNAQVSQGDHKKIINKYFTLERLEKSWGKRLKVLKGLKAPLVTHVNEELALYCEQFLANGLYRFIGEAEDVAYARAVALACVFSWWIINSVYQNERDKNSDLKSTFALICDIVREYSAEVEYSQKNQNKLFAFANGFVKI